MFDILTFAHQPSVSHLSTLTPSSSKTFAPESAEYSDLIAARISFGGFAVREFISPDCEYLRSGAMSSESGLS